MALPAIAEIFKHKDPPERLPASSPSISGPPEVLLERLATGAIRVLHRAAPGCAVACVAILAEGDEGYAEADSQLKE